MPRSSEFFPLKERKALWHEVEPRNYSRTITASALVQSLMIAFVARLSGLREMAERCGHLLATGHIGSLSHALRRGSSLAFVRRLVERLESTHTPGDEELVGVDGMPVTLPKTLRHQCAKYNDKTVGGGVVWAYMIEAAKAVTPVKILRIVEGAWHDTQVMRDVTLQANGPVYLMDRGFYALALVQKWLDERVRFIVRARKRSLCYTVLRTLSRPRSVGNRSVALDAIVRLGGASAKVRPVVRMVIAYLPSGEELILVTDRFHWSVQRILEAYRKRWRIERFHLFLKDRLGLAHLYSFHQSGIMSLLYAALLLALLLFFAAADPRGDTLTILRHMLKTVRRTLGLGTPWKRNMATPRRTKKKTNAKELETLKR